jgi:hypothetical protein
MAIHISRRDFIVTLGSAAAAWPLAARGQQPERVRRIGYLSPAKAAPIDAVFFEALRQLGWIEGNNASLEIRYAENDAARLARMADELVRLNVDVIVARARSGRSLPNEPPKQSRSSWRHQATRWGAGWLPVWLDQVATSLG